jgi:hypothetical protein
MKVFRQPVKVKCVLQLHLECEVAQGRPAMALLGIRRVIDAFMNRRQTNVSHEQPRLVSGVFIL